MQETQYLPAGSRAGYRLRMGRFAKFLTERNRMQSDRHKHFSTTARVRKEILFRLLMLNFLNDYRRFDARLVRRLNSNKSSWSG